MRVHWTQRSRLSRGLNCCVGNVKVGYVVLDMTRPKSDPKKYRVIVNLPSIDIKPQYEWHETEESAKSTLVEIITMWFAHVRKFYDESPEQTHGEISGDTTKLPN